MTETDIQNDIRVALSEIGVTCWRNNSGFASYENGRKVRYGLFKGSSDLIGITSSGRFVAIEVKTPIGRLTKEQKNFLEFIKSQGGISGVARSVADALALFSDPDPDTDDT